MCPSFLKPSGSARVRVLSLRRAGRSRTPRLREPAVPLQQSLSLGVGWLRSPVSSLAGPLNGFLLLVEWLRLGELSEGGWRAVVGAGGTTEGGRAIVPTVSPVRAQLWCSDLRAIIESVLICSWNLMKLDLLRVIMTLASPTATFSV